MLSLWRWRVTNKPGVLESWTASRELRDSTDGRHATSYNTRSGPSWAQRQPPRDTGGLDPMGWAPAVESTFF
jgi:hypothetical protein